MSRAMHGDQSAAFRAVITRTKRKSDGTVSTFTSYAGPYATVGAARSAITREKRYPGWQTLSVEGKVQRSSITWEDVDA